jgi:signal peptide peptidase SppA
MRTDTVRYNQRLAIHQRKEDARRAAALAAIPNPPAKPKPVEARPQHDENAAGAPHRSDIADVWLVSGDLARSLPFVLLEARPRPTLKFADGIAALDLVGILQKWQLLDVQRLVRQARDSSHVKALFITIDSGGSTLGGVNELHNELLDFRRTKPVHVHVEDQLRAGSYWAFSAANRITASGTTQIGDIGTYGVAIDQSKSFEKEGIKVHVIRAGQFKGAGTPGTEISTEVLAEMQRQVDSVNAIQLAAISAARKLVGSRLAAVADGRTWIAKDALGLGLIDALERAAGAFADLKRRVG